MQYNLLKEQTNGSHTSMASNADYRIGIDVGGTNLRLGVISGLKVIEEMRFQANFSELCKHNTSDNAWQKILKATAGAIQSALQTYPDVAAIGIGFPGFINPQTQVIAQSPNLPGLNDVNLSADLEAMLGRKVTVENDANAAAYGEYCLAGKPTGGLVYFGLGTGLGGGLIDADGKLYSGFHGFAMEAGHIIVEPNGRSCGCGNRGCVEQYASASGVAISYEALTNQKLTAHDIARQARVGDVPAQNAFNIAGDALAAMLAHVQKIVDVPNVVIGGGMSQGWDLMQTAFNARLEADLIPVLRGKINIQISNVGDQAGMLGAAMLT
jgi:glucokinase